MLVSTTVLLLILAFLLGSLLVVRRWLARKERNLGYPKAGESLEDVKLLILLQQDIFALRCYRRIYPKASLAEAKYVVNKLSEQFQKTKENITPQSEVQKNV